MMRVRWRSSHCTSELRRVAVEDHVAVLQMLAKRHKQLTSLKTQAASRFHAVLAVLLAGGMCGELSSHKPSRMLWRIRPKTMVGTERKQIAHQHLAEATRLEKEKKASMERLTVAVEASGTSLTDIYSVGPVVAGLLIGYTGDITPFPTKHHYAAYNGTAPIEASSGGRRRHRLNPRGNRKLNHALHLIVICQLRQPNTAGRVFYEWKLAEGKTKKEAIRSLKRRLSDVVYRQLIEDNRQGPGRTQGRLSNQRGRYSTLIKRLFDSAIPGQPQPYAASPTSTRSSQPNAP
jgi:transposase